MTDPDRLLSLLEAGLPGSAGRVRRWTNPGPSGQDALLVDPDAALEVALFLRDHPELQLDYCSNVTGVDWLPREVTESVTTTETVGGETKEVTKKVTRTEPGYLEAVYHLYSVALRHGPVILRLRAAGREAPAPLPSLTPVWRSAEFQEREIFDLYGISFSGHPDLRRLLLWDEFEGHPMRKDYVAPDEDGLPAIETAAAKGEANR
ncbi:MAG: NADH-quinone oxidoreductase subunit C [Puniceicoccaceae bacterium]|nr:MAG: NADH-quinone oxidoreductase subunit C [Puniceicoccaceae bacterium]